MAPPPYKCADRRAGLVVRASRAMAAITAIVAALLAAGGIPGAALRPAVYDLTPAPVLSDSQSQGGPVDVTVRQRVPAPGSPGSPDGGAGGPPIAGARVRAFALVGDRAVLADVRETDSAGHALLTKLPRGATWIVADAPGRARGSTRLVVEAEPRAVAIDLEPEHTIDVVVKDEKGAAIAGAEIEVAASGDPLPVGARAASAGATHVTRLAAGPWRVSARAPGYEEASGGAASDGDTVTIVLRRLGLLSVLVVGDGDHPVSGARVSVAGAMLWPARAAETDAHGDVRIGGLAAGVYALRAVRGDLVSAIELGIALGRGEEKSVVLRVAPGRWVGVRVTDGDGDDAQGIAAVRVTLAEGGLSPFPVETTTDAKGRARLGPVAGGPATLSARADGFVSRAVSLPDPLPEDTRVALVRAGVLTGRVVDERGYPIDGATVQIVGTDPSGAPIFDDPRRASFQMAHFDAMLAGPAPLVPAGVLGVMPGPVPPIPQSAAFIDRATPHTFLEAEPWVTRGDGTFRAAPASPGRLRAIVRHPQYVEEESEPVTLLPGGEANVDIVMHGGGALEGRVVDSHDRPVEGARVLVAAARGTLERTTRTASDGSFAFAALPEAVSVTASVDDDDEQPDVRVTLAIPERGRKDVTIRLPEPRQGLAVTVVDDRDWPIDRAQVSASSLSADVPLRTTAFTDAHGDAMLKRARGLPLRIEASAPGHAARVVTAGEGDDAVRIELLPAESATGEVVAALGGDPIAGAEVTLYTDLGVRHAETDARGEFALKELAPGAASLRVRAPGFGTVSHPVTIPDTGGVRPSAMPRVELAAEGVIEGDVVDARGNPVLGARIAKDHAPTWLAVGAAGEGVAVTDAAGRFFLRELAEGTVALEAYAPDLGRARVEGIRVVAGRATPNVHIVLALGAADSKRSGLPAASGSVAITLGETGAPVQVVIVSVEAGSEAERVGLAPGDVVLAVDEAAVPTIEEAREKMSGPLSVDVVVRVRRGDREFGVRVAREPVQR
jgi:carboxypeptidase family protein/PDZ domain-containing protein